ncbi:MAG: GNAT family N-acetyltransferase [Hyphomicrobium sp.]|nr:GNAT family N-acetyltransferase [Hyphomicrobium sp.]
MKTARLTLRPLNTADASRIAVLGGDWDVARMTGRIPYPYTAEQALHWVSDLAEGEVVFGIEHAGSLIGICGFSPDGNGSAEIGYWIGRPFWGQGFATEASQALMSYGFNKAGVKRFTCCHFTDNTQSARVARKLGFRSLGPCTGWSEARNAHLPTQTYERHRPWTSALKSTAMKALAS